MKSNHTGRYHIMHSMEGGDGGETHCRANVMSRPKAKVKRTEWTRARIGWFFFWSE